MENILTSAGVLDIWVHQPYLIIFAVGLASAQLRVGLLT